MDRRVGADGKITYPYLDEISVKEKSLAEVERMIRDGLKDDYIINPQVTVDFKEYVKEYVNVSGQVGMPGRIELPIDRRLDILDVLSLARDLTLRADQDHIELRRSGKEPQVFKMKALRAINDPEKKIYVEPGDQIYVKESKF
jgi:polysaccharide export outer membrane protein